MSQHTWQILYITFLERNKLAIDIKRKLALLNASLTPSLDANFAVCRLRLIAL